MFVRKNKKDDNTSAVDNPQTNGAHGRGQQQKDKRKDYDKKEWY